MKTWQDFRPQESPSSAIDMACGHRPWVGSSDGPNDRIRPDLRAGCDAFLIQDLAVSVEQPPILAVNECFGRGPWNRGSASACQPKSPANIRAYSLLDRRFAVTGRNSAPDTENAGWLSAPFRLP